MATIHGNAYSNYITGTSYADSIYAYEGDDTIDAGAGDDKIYSNHGDDIIYTGLGRDFVYSGDGNDIVKVSYEMWGVVEGGNVVNDKEVWAGRGDDFIDFTAPGMYRYNSGSLTLGGKSTIYGESGHDTLIGSPNNDKIYGGADNDRLIGVGGNDLLVGGTGADYLDGYGNDYRDEHMHIEPTKEIDTLRGNKEGGGRDYQRDVFDISGGYGVWGYAEYGNQDYALIKDFVIGEDRIQLGSGDYRITNASSFGFRGAAISVFSSHEYTTGQASYDLVAIVENVSVSSLSLSNTNQFIV